MTTINILVTLLGTSLFASSPVPFFTFSHEPFWDSDNSIKVKIRTPKNLVTYDFGASYIYWNPSEDPPPLVITLFSKLLFLRHSVSWTPLHFTNVGLQHHVQWLHRILLHKCPVITEQTAYWTHEPSPALCRSSMHMLLCVISSVTVNILVYIFCHFCDYSVK